jgi:nitrite reductase/ring-hydroxylating ferredoxin subunit
MTNKEMICKLEDLKDKKLLSLLIKNDYILIEKTNNTLFFYSNHTEIKILNKSYFINNNKLSLITDFINHLQPSLF